MCSLIVPISGQCWLDSPPSRSPEWQRGYAWTSLHLTVSYYILLHLTMSAMSLETQCISLTSFTLHSHCHTLYFTKLTILNVSHYTSHSPSHCHIIPASPSHTPSLSRPSHTPFAHLSQTSHIPLTPVPHPSHHLLHASGYPTLTLSQATVELLLTPSHTAVTP